MQKEIIDIAKNKFASSFNILFILKSTNNYPTMWGGAINKKPHECGAILSYNFN
jgi:hypothetical protein